MTVLLGAFLDSTARRLSPWSESPQLDSQVLIAHVIQKARTWILAHADAALEGGQLNQLEPLIRRFEGGEPLPYILGHQEFFGLDFEITPDVLIPRPETELLVERALGWLRRKPGHTIVADIGTGSGCVGVCLAIRAPDLRILATDISGSALEVARRNAARHAVLERIEYVECDLLPFASALQDHRPRFDLICANLPYIPTGTLRGLPVLLHEPRVALDGGADGLGIFRELLTMLPGWISDDGCILLEVEATLGAAAASLARGILRGASVNLHPDLAGRDRLLEIEPARA